MAWSRYGRLQTVRRNIIWEWSRALIFFSFLKMWLKKQLPYSSWVFLALDTPCMVWQVDHKWGWCVCVEARGVGRLYWTVLPSKVSKAALQTRGWHSWPVQSNITYPCGGPRRIVDAISCYSSDFGLGCVLWRDMLHIFIILQVSPWVLVFPKCA